MTQVAVATLRSQPCTSPPPYFDHTLPDSYRECTGLSGPGNTNLQMVNGYRSSRISPSSLTAPSTSDRSDYVDVVALPSPVEACSPSRSNSTMSVLSSSEEEELQQRESPEQEPEYHELRTVTNSWDRPVPPLHPSHSHQPSSVSAPYHSFNSTPDLRRSFSGVSANDLGLFGSSDRFSSYLNFSSDSLGSFKLSSSGDFPTDYSHMKSSQGTLDSGYGSMVLRSLVNDQQNLGSLKELSYSEVTDTLLSLKGSISVGSMPQISPSVGAAPANPIHGEAAGRVTRDLVSGATGSVPVASTPEYLPTNYRYHASYDDYPTSSGQHNAVLVPTSSYGNYRFHDPLYSNDGLTTLRPFTSASNDSLLHDSGSSLPLQDEISRYPDAPYWALTQSTPNVTETAQSSFTSSGFQQSDSPCNSTQTFPSRESIIKSTIMFEAHSSAPSIISESNVTSGGSDTHDAITRRSALRGGRGMRDAPFISRGSSAPKQLSLTTDADGSLHYCHFCKKGFSRPSTLKTHIKTHMGEKPYLCQVCGKTFFQAANLTAHIRVHSGEKPFSCHVCGKHFSQSSSVKTHMRTHSGERPYSCSVCRKSFSDNSTLTKHQRIHSGQKPYRCTVCQQSFSQSGNLSRHMKVHSRSMDVGNHGNKPLLVSKGEICVIQGSK